MECVFRRKWQNEPQRECLYTNSQSQNVFLSRRDTLSSQIIREHASRKSFAQMAEMSLITRKSPQMNLISFWLNQELLGAERGIWAKPPSPSAPTGQTAGSTGEALGGSPGDTAVTPCMGAQRPGAPSRLAFGAALSGVGEDQHLHPPGGTGHYRPPNRGLRKTRRGQAQWPGFTSVTSLVSEWDPEWIK